MLVPNLSSRSSLLERAKALGVGIWTKDHTPVKPEKSTAPASFLCVMVIQRVGLARKRRNRVNGEWRSA